MERILITIGCKKDLLDFEDCVATQNEWAEKNNLKHSIVEIEDSDQFSWEFYKTFISYFLQNEDKIVVAITPYVMILETFNPLFVIQKGIATNKGQTSFLMGKFDGSLSVRMILEKSLSFREVERVSCNLALEIVSTKMPNLVYFIEDLIVKPNYTRLIEELDQNGNGFEIHVNTNKFDRLKLAYNKFNYCAYNGGEFAVDLNLDNLHLSKGFILEFKKLKNKIMESYEQLIDIHKDINS